MRGLLFGIAVSTVLCFPAAALAAPASTSTVPKPSKTDICKSLGKLGGNKDYVPFKKYWNCQDLTTIKKSTPYTFNLACQIDTKKSWGYWTSDPRVTVQVLSYNKPPEQVSIAFLLKKGGPAKIRLWIPCKY